ncbi:MAG: hypothetical protein KIT42_11375, partial [Rhodocyclaceae bacterium]|nr:hypothetical protein [Rhodocyclaceae bacterium]
PSETRNMIIFIHDADVKNTSPPMMIQGILTKFVTGIIMLFAHAAILVTNHQWQSQAYKS